MSSFYSIMKRELSSVKKEKTIVLAILIQLLIASLSSVILVGLMSFYDPASIGQNSNIHVSMGIVGDANSPLVSWMREGGFHVSTFGSMEEARAAFNKGSIEAIMSIPVWNNGTQNMQLYLPPSDSQDTVITMMLEDPLKKYENYLRAQNGIHVRYTDVKGRPATTAEFLYSFIVPMLMFFPAFIAGSIIIDSISEEVENKTLDTLLSAPVSLNSVFGGKITAAILLAIMQCFAWLLLLSLNRLYTQNMALVLLLALIVASFVTFGSAIISLYFKDRERSQFAYSILLMTIWGLSMFVNPSPISLISRLAMGDTHVGLYDVLLFAIPLIALISIFFYASKKLLALKS
jgi:ABC-2 type transport system permease protein